MAISGTTTFNLGIDDIINEALSQVGGEVTQGEEVAGRRCYRSS